MSGIATAVIGGAVIGGVVQSRSAGKAADAQVESGRIATEEQRRQFDAIQKLLAPYVSAGSPALAGQQDLLGLNGEDAESSAIAGILRSPTYTNIVQEGETSILQNASATGGIRGGNVQEALARFRPEILNSLIESRFSKLGGIAQMGQASAVNQASAGQTMANNISSLVTDQGRAIAGKHLARGEAINGVVNSASLLGTWKLLGAF